MINTNYQIFGSNMLTLLYVLLLSAALVRAAPMTSPTPVTSSTPVATSTALVKEAATTERPLPIPYITGYKLNNDSYEMKWRQVENKECPILGYRVKIFEVAALIVNKTIINNGIEVVVQVREVNMTHNGTQTLIHDIDVPGAQNTTVLVFVTRHVIYENRVQAYCKDSMFPLSPEGARLRLGGGGEPPIAVNSDGHVEYLDGDADK